MNYKEYLTDNILKFWLDNAIDYDNGGIFTNLDKDGKIYGREKSVWFQGRALWVFSKTYNSVEKKPEYLKASECIFNFLHKCADADGRMFFTVTEDGRGLQKRRYYFSETFAAIGCTEYFLATGNEEAKKYAEKYFDTAYSIYKNPALTTPKLNPENAPYKSLSPVMIMLSTAQTLRKLDEEKYNAVAKEMISEIMTGGYLRDDVLLEHVYSDGSFADTPLGRTVNPGHSLEAAWFIMTEGVYQNDEDLIRAGLRIIDFSMKRGRSDGGIIAFCDYLGNPPTALEWDMKLWWPQCEALIANKMAYMLTKEEKYNADFNNLLEYTLSHFEDKDGLEWYGYLHYDNTVANPLKGNIFKGPFHIPRLFIWLALAEKGEIM